MEWVNSIANIFVLVVGPITGALVAGFVGVKFTEHNRSRDRESKRSAVARVLLAELCRATTDIWMAGQELHKATDQEATTNINAFAIFTGIDTTLYRGIGHDIASLSNSGLRHVVSAYSIIASYENRIKLLRLNEGKMIPAKEMWETVQIPKALATIMHHMEYVKKDAGESNLPDKFDELMAGIDAWLGEVGFFAD